MAHFAKIVDGVVDQVIVADTQEWCETHLGGTWVQTSYNTHGDTHALGGTPLHKNFAGIGFSWDGVGFAAPQPYASWTLDGETYLWTAPTPEPTEGGPYKWDEDNQEWVELSVSE
jgi:hypothetical protein